MIANNSFVTLKYTFNSAGRLIFEEDEFKENDVNISLQEKQPEVEGFVMAFRIL